jgi:hypothetical protein
MLDKTDTTGTLSFLSEKPRYFFIAQRSDTEQFPADDSTVCILEFLNQLRRSGSRRFFRLSGRIFISPVTAVHHAQDYRHGRNGAARALPVAGYPAEEAGARPQHVIVFRFPGFPHDLQDARPSVVALVHIARGPFERFVE